MKLRPEFITKTKETRLYQLPVPIIGLTGGIATGKSTVAQLFRDLGVNVLDADSLVKKIYTKPEAILFIKNTFPEAYQDNAIEFKILRKVVFTSAINQEKIEQFIYSHLPQTFLEAYSLLPQKDFLIYDVPLLFEKKLNECVDCSLCVYTSRETQLSRLTSRDKIDLNLAELILSKQLDIEEKKKLSTVVIDNSGDLPALKLAFKSIQELLTQ